VPVWSGAPPVVVPVPIHEESTRSPPCSLIKTMAATILPIASATVAERKNTKPSTTSSPS